MHLSLKTLVASAIFAAPISPAAQAAGFLPFDLKGRDGRESRSFCR
jgi:hypothetical protein